MAMQCAVQLLNDFFLQSFEVLRYCLQDCPVHEENKCEKVLQPWEASLFFPVTFCYQRRKIEQSDSPGDGGRNHLSLLMIAQASLMLRLSGLKLIREFALCVCMLRFSQQNHYFGKQTPPQPSLSKKQTKPTVITNLGEQGTLKAAPVQLKPYRSISAYKMHLKVLRELVIAENTAFHLRRFMRTGGGPH